MRKSSEELILIIDDDENNLQILEMDLEDEPYGIIKATDGVKGWQQLQDNKEKIRVILLDRMMPNMDGMQFMQKVMADPTVSKIPVIMQTAAAEKEQVIQGVQAGVYYYLTKPYEQDIMLSLVRAAIKDFEELNVLKKELEQYKKKLNIVQESRFEIRTLADVRYLTTFLSNFFPDPDRVVLGISELLLNSLEHGNLGITYEEKTRLILENIWEKEIIRLQDLPEFKEKKVLVHFKRENDYILLNIKDEGKGFDWNEYLDITPERATHCHGRGVALSKMISFDEIQYNGCGNEVTCKVYINNVMKDNNVQ